MAVKFFVFFFLCTFIAWLFHTYILEWINKWSICNVWVRQEIGPQPFRNNSERGQSGRSTSLNSFSLCLIILKGNEGSLWRKQYSIYTPWQPVALITTYSWRLREGFHREHPHLNDFLSLDKLKSPSIMFDYLLFKRHDCQLHKLLRSPPAHHLTHYTFLKTTPHRLSWWPAETAFTCLKNKYIISSSGPRYPFSGEGGLLCPALRTRACWQWRTSHLPWSWLWMSSSPFLLKHLDILPRCPGPLLLS